MAYIQEGLERVLKYQLSVISKFSVISLILVKILAHLSAILQISDLTYQRANSQVSFPQIRNEVLLGQKKKDKKDAFKIK